MGIKMGFYLFCRRAASFNKALKREDFQLAVFTLFNILANYKFPLSGALRL
jgi:hypothetical protein